MDNNLDKVALELYGKIQTRFPDIKIGDENAKVLSKKSEIPDARFFEFEYEENGEPLGTIAITLDEDDGIVIQVSGELANDTTVGYHDAFRFIRSFRKFAKNRLLNFDVQNIGKSNLDKRDYQFQAKPTEIPQEIPMMESKMFGTSRISYQDLGDARLIVKHTKPVNQDFAAGRSQHIKGIYIENADGERFKYPYKHLHGARALAEHIKHGGNPYDSIGKHITGLSEELSQLRKFKGYVSRQAQVSEAMGSVTDKVLERIEAVKKEVHNLQRGSYYEQFAESFSEAEERMIPEEIMNDWVDRLTVRTFNEDLKSVFPYLYNIVDESELPILEIGADDLLDEAFGKAGLSARLKKQGFGDSDYWEKAEKEKEERHSKADMEMAQREKEWKEKFAKKDESFDPTLAFETFIERIVTENKDELFSPAPGAQNKAVEEFNIILASELVGGTAGMLALKGIIDDPELIGKIEVLDSDEEIRREIKEYILDRNPKLIELLPALHTDTPSAIGGADSSPQSKPPMPDPVPTPAGIPPDAGLPPAGIPPDAGLPPAGIPPMPMAENINKSSKMKAKFIKAKTAGATLDTPFANGMTIRDAIKECGLTPMECGFPDGQSPNLGRGITQLLRIVAGFWNKEAQNFTIGGTRAKIKVMKAFEDGDCPAATEDEVKRVLLLIDKKDPSSDNQGPHQRAVVRVAGDTHQSPDDRESSLVNNLQIMQERQIAEGILSQIKRNAGLL